VARPDTFGLAASTHRRHDSSPAIYPRTRVLL
jgi:hypothetical protein